jgi:hypothetical protein
MAAFVNSIFFGAVMSLTFGAGAVDDGVVVGDGELGVEGVGVDVLVVGVELELEEVVECVVVEPELWEVVLVVGAGGAGVEAGDVRLIDVPVAEGLVHDPLSAALAPLIDNAVLPLPSRAWKLMLAIKESLLTLPARIAHAKLTDPPPPLSAVQVGKAEILADKNSRADES